MKYDDKLKAVQDKLGTVPNRAISQMTGVPLRAVQLYCQGLGITAPRPYKTKAKEGPLDPQTAMRAMPAEELRGMSLDALASQYNIPKGTAHIYREHILTPAKVEPVGVRLKALGYEAVQAMGIAELATKLDTTERYATKLRDRWRAKRAKQLRVARRGNSMAALLDRTGQAVPHNTPVATPPAASAPVRVTWKSKVEALSTEELLSTTGPDLDRKYGLPKGYASIYRPLVLAQRKVTARPVLAAPGGPGKRRGPLTQMREVSTEELQRATPQELNTRFGTHHGAAYRRRVLMERRQETAQTPRKVSKVVAQTPAPPVKVREDISEKVLSQMQEDLQSLRAELAAMHQVVLDLRALHKGAGMADVLRQIAEVAQKAVADTTTA